jgi:hypothetical protein
MKNTFYMAIDYVCLKDEGHPAVVNASKENATTGFESGHKGLCDGGLSKNKQLPSHKENHRHSYKKLQQQWWDEGRV